ncbi:PREDICTED: 40S ribosomal protein S21-like, partial [Wasmannia auropunctata]
KTCANPNASAIFQIDVSSSTPLLLRRPPIRRYCKICCDNCTIASDVDPETGRMTDTHKMYAICGAIRRMGESDDCIVRLTKNDGLLSKNF